MPGAVHRQPAKGAMHGKITPVMNRCYVRFVSGGSQTGSQRQTARLIGSSGDTDPALIGSDECSAQRARER